MAGIVSVAVDPTNSKPICAASNGTEGGKEVFKSTDGGKHRVWGMALDPQPTSTLYCAWYEKGNAVFKPEQRTAAVMGSYSDRASISDDCPFGRLRRRTTPTDAEPIPRTPEATLAIPALRASVFSRELRSSTRR
jgi:hypothetical protein